MDDSEQLKQRLVVHFCLFLLCQHPRAFISLMYFFRKLAPPGALMPIYLFVVNIILACCLAILAGGPVRQIVGFGATSIAIFTLPIGLICQYVDRNETHDSDKDNSDPEAADVSQEVAQPVVRSPQYVARLFLLRQIEQHQRTGPHPRMEVDPSSGSVTIVVG